MRTSATGHEFIPSALRSAPGHLNDAARDRPTSPRTSTAKANSRANWQASGKTIDAAGGWWDAGDYLKFVQTTSYAVDLQLIGVRDFPAQMGASAAALELHRRGALRSGMAAAHVERQHPHALLPGRDRRRQRRTPSATTTSGGCRRQMTPTAAKIRASASSATGPCSAPGRRGRPSARTWPAATRPRSRSASRCSRTRFPNSPRAACRPAEHIFELADTDPAGTPADRDSRSASIRRPNGATTSSSARPSSPSRCPAERRCRPACRTPNSRSTTSNRRRAGRRPTSPTRRRRANR